MYYEYDEEMLDQIDSGVDLIKYVSKDLELEKHGNEYFAHCPKHIDKTASLSFTPSTNKYYCFSCGRGGGVINYIHQYEGLPFDQAVNKAAKLANVDLDKMCKSETIMFLKKLHKNKLNIREKYNHPVLEYSEFEKFRKDRIEEWEDEGIQKDVMDEFDIRIDRLGNRIVYPVYDINGNLINIKGRTRYLNYKKMGIPKYINYKPVGCLDYFQCLNITKPFIMQSGEIIVFESIKSVMKAFGWGYKNCVSAETHTLTEEQLRILISLKATVVFAFDSDVGYKDKGVKNIIEKLKRFTNVYIIVDDKGVLGGKDAKNAPVDLGKGVWEQLYKNKRRVS